MIIFKKFVNWTKNIRWGLNVPGYSFFWTKKWSFSLAYLEFFWSKIVIWLSIFSKKWPILRSSVADRPHTERRHSNRYITVVIHDFFHVFSPVLFRGFVKLKNSGIISESKFSEKKLGSFVPFTKTTLLAPITEIWRIKLNR